jgi:hypothetical protein
LQIVPGAMEWNLRSAVGATIVVDGRLWGVIIASWGDERSPPDDTEERMAKFAQLLDTAIANADSRDQVEDATDRRVADLIGQTALTASVDAAAPGHERDPRWALFVRSIAARRWWRPSEGSRQAGPGAHPSRYQRSGGLGETDRAPPLVGRALVAHRRVAGVVPPVLAHALHATLMTEQPRALHLQAGGHDCQVTLIRLRANARPPAYRVFATGDRRP